MLLPKALDCLRVEAVWWTTRFLYLTFYRLARLFTPHAVDTQTTSAAFLFHISMFFPFAGCGYRYAR